MPNRDHGAIPPDHGIGVGEAGRPARRLVEEHELAAAAGGNAPAVVEQRFDGSRRDAALTVQVSRTTTGVVPATSQSTMSDEQFLDEIEAALQARRAHSLRALDALTPTAADLQDFPLGQR